MAHQPPTFSVIVPTYRRPVQLATCLAALGRLDYPSNRFEVIVVDDGSGAPPEATIVAFHDRLDVHLLTQAHAGPATARNTGAGRATGEILAFTDDDCAPAPGWLRALAAHSDDNPGCVVGGRTVNVLVDNACATASQLLIDYLYAYYNADRGRARFFASNNLAVPAACFRAIGAFDTATPFAGGEDREFCDRWLARGRRMAYAPAAIVEHSHPLTVRTFWRQHFTYGRGAYYFHRARRRRGTRRMLPEPISFYVNLLREPLLATSHHPRLFLVALLALSQVANAAGYIHERRTRGRIGAS